MLRLYTHFEADIKYPDTKTQIPNSYTYMYKINGEIIRDTFKNVNPDEYNKVMLNSTETATETIEEGTDAVEVDKDLSRVDTNENGKVTIAEAKSAGYEMLIYLDHWLYPYMQDRDGNGVVGE